MAIRSEWNRGSSQDKMVLAQAQQTFSRGGHNGVNYQKYVEWAEGGYSKVFWGICRYSKVFWGILARLKPCHPGSEGDNRRTGVKMDLIEDTILTATPLVQCEMREAVVSSKSHPGPTKPLISEWKATLHSGHSNMCGAYLGGQPFGRRIEKSNAKRAWFFSFISWPIEGQVGVQSGGEQKAALEVLHRYTGC